MADDEADDLSKDAPAAAAAALLTDAGRVEWFYGDHADPVFEGMLKDFSEFDEALQEILQQLEVWVSIVDEFCGSLLDFPDRTAFGFAACSQHRDVLSDGLRWRQATNQIALRDAPQSAVSKLRRNLDYNVIAPVKEHLDFNEKLRKELLMRNRRLEELRDAKRQIDECCRVELSVEDQRYRMAQTEFELSRKCFRKVDRHVFEWLYTLGEHKDDILDSTLQTLKYIVYEFFAQSAHAMGQTLPDRMAFRPMRDMDPAQLEREVERCKQEPPRCSTAVASTSSAAEGRERGGGGAAAGDGGGPAAARRFAELLAERQAEEPDEALCEVDQLSLCSLLVQGFEEGPARRALRLHNNDTQLALEHLLQGGREQLGSEGGARRPTARREAVSSAAVTPWERGSCEPRGVDIGVR